MYVRLINITYIHTYLLTYLLTSAIAVAYFMKTSPIKRILRAWRRRACQQTTTLLENGTNQYKLMIVITQQALLVLLEHCRTKQYTANDR